VDKPVRTGGERESRSINDSAGESIPDDGFHVEKLKDLCIRYKKFIATGTLVVVLAVVIACTAALRNGGDSGDDGDPKQQTAVDDTSPEDGEVKFEVNAHEEINKLIGDYYNYHAKGDIASLEKIAYPVSDTEKSYIELFSQYTEEYEDITCYTKKGVADGEFIVSVTLNIKFQDIDTPAPGLDSFYVRTDENGSYYIDNVYSVFNQRRKEFETDETIDALIEERDEDQDAIDLLREVNAQYEKAIDSDEALKELVGTTIPDKMSSWVSSFADNTSTGDTSADDGNSQDGATKTDDGNNQDGAAEADDTRTDDTKTDDGKDTDTKAGEDGKDDGKDEEPKDDDSADKNEKKPVVKKVGYAKTKVNIREKRSTDSEVVKTIKAGTKVMVYGKSSKGWYKVRSRGKYGFVKDEYIVFDESKVEKPAPEPEETEQTSSPSYLPEGKQITLEQSLNVRASMSESADRVGLAYQGDVITVIMSYAEGWTKVSWNGQTGYIKTELLANN